MNNPQLAQSNEKSRLPLLILFSLVFLLIATLASSYDPITYAHGSDEDPIKQMVAVTCAQIPGSEISSAECVALQAFYNSTNGSSWGNWFTNSTPCSTPWTGLTCANGHVTNIYLKGLNISGTLPTELGNLSWLLVFKADSNNISGTIPASLGDLSNLTELDIGENDLNGSIPTTLCKLSNLWRLDLIQNQLTGPFPSCSNVQLGSLEILYVDGNNLSGSLPSSIGYMSQLTQLSLARNNFDGSVPDAICSLTNLQALWVNTTSLSGPLPSCMPGMNQLSKFRFNETTICEPGDSTFQNWLDNFSSSNLSRTGVICPGSAVPTVQFRYSSPSVNENVGNAAIEVTLTQSSSQTVTVTYATSNGTAKSGSDYTSRSGTLSFSPGQTSKTFTVPIINDSIDENNESFYVSLSNVGNADLGSPSTSTLTIVDDDSSIPCYALGTSVNPSGSGSINVSPSPNCSGGTYTAGTTVQLTATANSGYSFLNWSGDASGSSTSTSVTMDGNRNVQANFIILCYRLTLSHSGSGDDPVASPSRSNGCGTGDYVPGEQISLTAVPASGWYVASWTGTQNNGSSSTNNSLTMPAGVHTATVHYVELTQKILLPLISDRYINYFEGPWEAEDNDSYKKANGPLRSGQEYFGRPDDERDFFTIAVEEPGRISIDLLGHSGERVQLQLYYQTVGTNMPVAVDLSEDDHSYHISYPLETGATAAPGTYYIWIFTGDGNNSTQYTLKATYPMP